MRHTTTNPIQAKDLTDVIYKVYFDIEIDGNPIVLSKTGAVHIVSRVKVRLSASYVDSVSSAKTMSVHIGGGGVYCHPVIGIH
ncbi:unnamed protein product [Urochloa humidicola]